MGYSEQGVRDEVEAMSQRFRHPLSAVTIDAEAETVTLTFRGFHELGVGRADEPLEDSHEDHINCGACDDYIGDEIKYQVEERIDSAVNRVLDAVDESYREFAEALMAALGFKIDCRVAVEMGRTNLRRRINDIL